MKAAVFHGRGDVRVEDVPDPAPPPAGWVLVRVLLCGVCGTDAHEWRHGPNAFVTPLVIGHELVGLVAAVGEGVADLREGDRVVSGGGVSCGTCPQCLRGRTNLCERYVTIGHQVPGALAEYVAVPADTCLVVPPGCPGEHAALAQPLAVAVHAVRRSAVGSEAAAVVGAGAVGSLIVAALAGRGRGPVTAVDVDPARESTARRLGATRWSVPSATAGPIASGEHDVVFETSGTTDGLASALALSRRGGRVVLVGLPAGPVPLALLDVVRREVDLVPSAAHVCAEDLPEAMRLLAEGTIGDAVVDRVVPLASVVERALRPLATGRARGKILVDPTTGAR